jgi:uncharacterized glyoxalase superfamily protein PhnB
MPVRPAIMPCLLYDDAPGAIDFICNAFGFTRLAIHADGATVHNAQLAYDGNVVMLSSGSRDGRDQFDMTPIGNLNGRSPMCICVVIDDPDAHFETARAAGARIITEPHDNDYGGRSYEARDPEGVVWSFGNYDPWADAAKAAAPQASVEQA